MKYQSSHLNFQNKVQLHIRLTLKNFSVYHKAFPKYSRANLVISDIKVRKKSELIKYACDVTWLLARAWPHRPRLTTAAARKHGCKKHIVKLDICMRISFSSKLQ